MGAQGGESGARGAVGATAERVDAASGNVLVPLEPSSVLDPVPPSNKQNTIVRQVSKIT